MVRLILILFLTGTSVSAQHSHGETTSPILSPTEPGQGAFAAIAEIVAILQANPKTDWSRVNISALREHLLDMDNLVSHAEVTTQDIPNGVRFSIQTGGKDGGAAGRMVPAHAPVLAGETGWVSVARTEGNVVFWEVRSEQNAEMLRALGFFGLLAVGWHHQEHHLGIASGEMVH